MLLDWVWEHFSSFTCLKQKIMTTPRAEEEVEKLDYSHAASGNIK